MTRSLRLRLQIWHALLLVAVLLGFGTIVDRLLWETRLHQLDAELERASAVLTSSLRRMGTPSFRRGPRPPETPPPAGPAPSSPARDDGAPAAGPALTAGTDPSRDPLSEPSRDRRSGDGRGRSDRTNAGGPFPFQPGASSRSFAGWWERLKAQFEIPEEYLELFRGDPGHAAYFVIWNHEGDVFRKSDSAPEVPFPDLHGSPNGLPIKVFRDRAAARELIVVTRFDMNILVGRPLIDAQAAQHSAQFGLLASGFGVLACGLAGGWWFSRQAVRPLAGMTRTASAISAQNLNERIDVAGVDDELRELASVLNGTFDRLQAAVEQQRRFTADASHELRTPLAIILTNAELALDPRRTLADHRTAWDVSRRAALRMKSLVQSLLTLARLDAREVATPHAPVELADLARDCLDLVRPLADDKGLEVSAELAPSWAAGDREQLAQVVMNLLTNAIQYNQRQGRIDLRVASDEAHATLTVTDTGVGIPAEQLAHIFERFFCADQARSHAHGGCGLGLAICQAIVAAHGGTITAESEPGAGTTIQVRLPRVPAPQDEPPSRIVYDGGVPARHVS